MDPTAVFLGPQGQNADTQERLFLEALRDHVHWRRGLHAEDPDAIDPFRQLSHEFRASQAQMEAGLRRLLARLKGSIPFHSPRYLGHMTSDTLLPAQVGYVAAMLYNPNNVAQEGSPVTSDLEHEVVRDLASLVGFDPERAAGHLCSGGTAANVEALWILRNLAAVPLALKGPDFAAAGPVREIGGRLFDPDHDDASRLIGRLSPATLVSLASRLRRTVDCFPPMAVLAPVTRHYSWDKAMNLLGFPGESLIPVPVDSDLRMDADALEQILMQLGREGRNVLACIGVVGTTEGGAVDPIDRLFEIRRRHAERYGQWFFIHLDAAYGGYARALFRKPSGELRSLKEMEADLHGLRPGLHAAMAAMGNADSVTIDPHKLGFVPYPAGALVLRDRAFQQVVAVHAAYVNAQHPEHIGSFTLEGSRPGAAAAACWLAHRTVSLDDQGHGAILLDSFKAARRLSQLLDGRTFGQARCCVWQAPDLDIVLYAFAPLEGATLSSVNMLQDRVLQRLGPTGRGPFAVTSTTLTAQVHGEAVLPFLARLGVSSSDWRPGAHLTLLRSVMMTPFVAHPEVRTFYRERLVEALNEAVQPQ